MPPVEFEPTISGGERPQTYALDRKATGIGHDLYINIYIFIYLLDLLNFHSHGPGVRKTTLFLSSFQYNYKNIPKAQIKPTDCLHRDTGCRTGL